MKKVIALLFFLLAAATVIFVIFFPSLKAKPESKISNFEECVKAGYPVMESYPRQCTVPGGRFFVEQVVPER